MKKLLILFLFLACSKEPVTTVSGYWSGVYTVGLYEYWMEMDIIQSGNRINGTIKLQDSPDGLLVLDSGIVNNENILIYTHFSQFPELHFYYMGLFKNDKTMISGKYQLWNKGEFQLEDRWIMYKTHQ